jgi:hypothetical protein
MVVSKVSRCNQGKNIFQEQGSILLLQHQQRACQSA